MKIHAIEELTSGHDGVIALVLHESRIAAGVSIEVAAWSTGADVVELRALESGQLNVFADVERLRLVLLAYCDYLDVDPSPLAARLEAYFSKGLCIPPNLHAAGPWEVEKTDFRRATHALVFASCLIIPIYFAWSLLIQ